MLKRIYRLLDPVDRKKCVGLVFNVLFRSLLNFAGLAAIFPLLNHLLNKQSEASNGVLMFGGVLLFILVKNILIFSLTRIQTSFLLRQFKHFSFMLFCSYYRRGLLFIKRKGVVQLANDVNTLCLNFSVSVLNSILSIAGEAVLVLMVMAALLFFSPVAALFLFMGFVPLVLFYVLVLRKRMRAYGKEDLQARRKQARTVVETFRGFAELEVNGAFPFQLKNFESGLDIINHSRQKLEMIHSLPLFLSEFSIVLALAMLFFIQGDNMLLVGGTFALAAFRLMPSIRTILNSWTSLQQSSYCIETLEEELGDAYAPQPQFAPITFEHELKADSITFQYPDGKPVLENFSCTIRKGECVGVRGYSGVGKSTLFNVLLGFYPLRSGRVVVDGVTLNESSIPAWHRLVGYVPQNIFILQASLAENVALGASVVDEERVREVLRMVHLDEWLQTLPDGLDTQLGESGSRLSGGQCQRIGIARALYKRAEVLFFDEATSSLDNQTESEINQTLRTLSEEQTQLTMVIIAHRDSSLAFCDRCIELGSSN